MAIHEDARTNNVLECDIEFHHEIRIFKAEYRVMKKAPYRPRDNENLNESCLIRGLTAEIREKCHRKHGCLFMKEDFDKYAEESAARFPYRCDSYIGARYLLIEWQCRAGKHHWQNKRNIALARTEKRQMFDFTVVHFANTNQLPTYKILNFRVKPRSQCICH